MSVMSILVNIYNKGHCSEYDINIVHVYDDIVMFVVLYESKSKRKHIKQHYLRFLSGK